MKATHETLPFDPPDGSGFINQNCRFHDNDGFRAVFFCGLPIYRVSLDDIVQLRFVAVALRQGGMCTQPEIARVFGHSVGSQCRWERRFEENGLDGLRDRARSGRPRSLDTGQISYVRRWFKEGISNREMARRLGVSEASIRRDLKRLGLERPAPPTTRKLSFDEHAESSLETAEEEKPEPEATPPGDCQKEEKAGDAEVVDVDAAFPVTATFDADPLNRVVDRTLASRGLLEDAAPLFSDAQSLPRAGVLLALPLLLAGGALSVFANVYRSLGPAFYGLRTSVVCLFLMALLRIKRPEHLKEYSPRDLGRILGLDRAPEVKTLRRKLKCLAAQGKGEELMRGLAELRIKRDEERVGFLYLDGHVREYHGKAKLGMAHLTGKRISAPAATDTWVNDREGDPLFVVTSELNAGLTKMLVPVLEEVADLVPKGRKLTVVFDRGGYSPALFARIVKKGFDLITYRKGTPDPVDPKKFVERTFEADDGRHTYNLHEKKRVPVGTKKTKGKKKIPHLYMRQVTRLREDREHQTQVLTTRKDLLAEEVLYRMFHRWRQENFFKYMLAEFALDALTEYGTEELSKDADRPNPKRKALEKKRNKAREKLRKLEAELGEAVAENDESRRRTVRGFKIAHSDLRKTIEETRREVESLTERIAGLPKRAPADDLRQLKRGQRLIVDAVKMMAYQVETELYHLLDGIYARVEEEGRTLLHAAFQSSAQLEVSDKELRVTIAPQSSHHRTEALRELCNKLNQRKTRFPGTDLRLTLAVSALELVTT